MYSVKCVFTAPRDENVSCCVSVFLRVIVTLQAVVNLVWGMGTVVR